MLCDLIEGILLIKFNNKYVKPEEFDPDPELMRLVETISKRNQVNGFKC